MAPIISGITLIALIALLLSPLPTISAVQDTDNEPVINGGLYYILPIGDGGNLALTQKAGEPPSCLNYITRKPASQPIPARLSSPLRILFLPSTWIRITFNTNLTSCAEPPAWGVNTDKTNGKVYVVSDGTETTSFNYDFTIEEAAESSGATYKIKYCTRDEEGGSECGGYLGFFKENGLMGITNENPLVVEFKKVNENSGLSSMI